MKEKAVVVSSPVGTMRASWIMSLYSATIHAEKAACLSDAQLLFSSLRTLGCLTLGVPHCLDRAIYESAPESTMVGLNSNLTWPVPEPVFSRSWTTFMDSWSATSPKTTCLPSNQEVTTVVMKN